jgi:phage gp36-like protein
MAYGTPANLRQRYPEVRLAEVSDDDGQAADDPRLQVALDDASAEIDTWIGQRYLLPLVSTPPVLVRLACDIAMYRLMALLPKESVADARRRYEDALAWLEDLAKGAADLPDGAGEELPSASTGSVKVASLPRRFTRETLEGFL